jgi:hypothetical protein
MLGAIAHQPGQINMKTTILCAGLLLGALLNAALWVSPATAQNAPTQNTLMQKLDIMKGTWVGEAKGIGRDGKPYVVRQTERVGSMLNGDVLIIEGRGYRSDGTLAFNALGTVSADEKTGGYEIRAYAQGRSGTYRMEASANGVIWEIPAGPQATMRYTIAIDKDVWHEVGEYIAKDQPPRQMIEMKLKRTGDTTWPQ